jgi:hypothetical protein
MKIIIAALILVFAVLACGCTSQAPVSSPPGMPNASAVPDYTGRWIGKAYGITLTEGYYETPVVVYNFSVQRGSIVSGSKEYTRTDGKTYSENFFGIISQKGDLVMGDSLNGYTFITLLGPDTLELRNVEAGPDAKAMYMVLTRQKS